METIVRDPFWADYASFVNLKIKASNPEQKPDLSQFPVEGPHIPESMAILNLQKLQAAKLGSLEDIDERFNKIYDISEEYVMHIHERYSRNVPRTLVWLYVFCLWVDQPHPTPILADVDLEELQRYFKLRTVERREEWEKRGSECLDMSAYDPYLEQLKECQTDLEAPIVLTLSHLK